MNDMTPDRNERKANLKGLALRSFLSGVISFIARPP